MNYQTYVALKGSYQFGNNSEFNSSNSSTGTYRSDGYDIDATVGHVFWLWNTMSQTPAIAKWRSRHRRGLPMDTPSVST